MAEVQPPIEKGPEIVVRTEAVPMQRGNGLAKWGAIGLVGIVGWQLLPRVDNMFGSLAGLLNISGLGNFETTVEIGEADIAVQEIVGVTDLRVATVTERVTHEIEVKQSIPGWFDANQTYKTDAIVNAGLCFNNNGGSLTGITFTPIIERGEATAIKATVDLNNVLICDINIDPTACVENPDGATVKCKRSQVGGYSASEFQETLDAVRDNDGTREQFERVAGNVLVGAVQFSGACIAQKLGDASDQQVFFSEAFRGVVSPVLKGAGFTDEQIQIVVKNEMIYPKPEALGYVQEGIEGVEISDPVLSCELSGVAG